MKERWFDAFRRDPHQAVSDLFTGRAGVGAGMRLDVPELLHQWFPKNMADDRCRLDEALLGWLREMQHDYRGLVKHLGFPVYGKRVGDALIALQLLDLRQAKDAMREDLAAWLRWLSPLRLAPERDPALECYGLLTQGQPDLGQLPIWLRLAADGRPEYLTVALAGLRRLPNGGDARQNQVLMLQALLRHAVVRFHEVNGADHFFNRRFAAVRGLFPRAPNHWKGVLDDALHGFEHVKTPVAIGLVARLREKHLAKKPPVSSRRTARLPVQEHVWRALERDVVNSKQPADELVRRLFVILDQNHEHAVETGGSYPFVRTLSNLGSKLLKRGLRQDNMARFGVMIERALVWEPANPYCWMLWAEWFKAQGVDEAQEAILRETLRLFPRDVAAQVALASLLIAWGPDYWAEAKHSLRRTIKQDPTNGHAHVVMARLFGLLGEHDAAEKTLASSLARDPGNSEAREALKKLQAGTHSYAAMDHEPDNRTKWQAASTDVPQVVPIALQEVRRRGGLTGEFSRARIGGRGTVQTTLIEQEARNGDALAGFYSQWLRLPDTPDCPPNAWAWKACQHWQQSASPDVWARLVESFPQAASETHFLRALAWPKTSHGGQHGRHFTNGISDRPVDTVMRECGELVASSDLDHNQRENIACVLMACAAVDAPVFSQTEAQMLLD